VPTYFFNRNGNQKAKGAFKDHTERNQAHECDKANCSAQSSRYASPAFVQQLASHLSSKRVGSVLPDIARQDRTG